MAKSGYQQYIREDLARIGKIGVDPRHVEGWMRLEFGTLDHLSKERFRLEVELAVQCIEEAGVKDSEELALSYGL